MNTEILKLIARKTGEAINNAKTTILVFLAGSVVWFAFFPTEKGLIAWGLIIWSILYVSLYSYGISDKNR